MSDTRELLKVKALVKCNQTSSLNVYYDGSCPLCRAEISFYQRRKSSSEVNWVDVSVDADLLLPDGLDQEQAMSRFHVATEHGQTLSGARAFLELWKQYPGLKWLAKMGCWPPLAFLLEKAYCAFLRFRPYLSRLLKARQVNSNPDFIAK